MFAQSGLQFEADELELFDKKGFAVLTGHVKVWNDTGRIESNRLEVYYGKGGDTVNQIKAYGEVKISYPRLDATSKYAERDMQSDTLVLQENVYVRRDRNEFWADWMKVNLQNSTLKMKENVRGNLISNSGATLLQDE